jgi:hypothetical protein
MNLNIFEDWLSILNKRMKSEKRKIFLVLDNATVHPVEISLSNVKLLYLPKNTTSRTQPLDQGIIRSFKSKYRSMLLEKIVLHEEMEYGKIINLMNLLQCVNMIQRAWSEVSLTTIKNCFFESGIYKKILDRKTCCMKKQNVIYVNWKKKFRFVMKCLKKMTTILF